MVEQMLVDSHVHFWDPQERRHAWLDGQPSLRRRFGPEDYGGGGRVAALIFVQADCRADEALDEVRWAAELAARDPRVRGIVAYAPVHLGAIAAAPIAAVAAQPGVVGVRRLLQDEPPSSLTTPRSWREMSRAAAAGCRSTSASAVGGCALWRVVAACPDVTFVLDHLGEPPVATGAVRRSGRSRSARGQWPRRMQALGTDDGGGARLAPGGLRPYLDVALDIFGPLRCMLGGD